MNNNHIGTAFELMKDIATEEGWNYSESTQILKRAMNDRMFPLTMEGLSKAMQMLKTANKRTVNPAETDFR